MPEGGGGRGRVQTVVVRNEEGGRSAEGPQGSGMGVGHNVARGDGFCGSNNQGERGGQGEGGATTGEAVRVEVSTGAVVRTYEAQRSAGAGQGGPDSSGGSEGSAEKRGRGKVRAEHGESNRPASQSGGGEGPGDTLQAKAALCGGEVKLPVRLRREGTVGGPKNDAGRMAAVEAVDVRGVGTEGRAGHDTRQPSGSGSGTSTEHVPLGKPVGGTITITHELEGREAGKGSGSALAHERKGKGRVLKVTDNSTEEAG